MMVEKLGIDYLAADNVTMKADGRKNHCKVSLVESNTPLFKESSSGSYQ